MEVKPNSLQAYLAWRGDLSLAQSGFCEVDGLILSILSYLDYPDLSDEPQPLAKALADSAAHLDPEKGLRLLDLQAYAQLGQLAAECRRFAGFRVCSWICERDVAQEKQFSAICFLLPDGTVYLAFRGTDSTLVGWKEDFNMSFCTEVPAQAQAAQYAAEMAERYAGRQLRLGGHSKGGNLALWAAANLPEDVQQRILSVCSYDGPGFLTDFFASEGFGRIADRAETFIPESSIVGMLLRHPEEYTVIDSSSHALLQHEPLSWLVQGPAFIRRTSRSRFGRYSDAVIRGWADSMSAGEREAFIDALFDILGYGRTQTLEELTGPGLAANLARAGRTYSALPEAHKKLIQDILRRLAEEMGGQLRRTAREALPEQLPWERKEKP